MCDVTVPMQITQALEALRQPFESLETGTIEGGWEGAKEVGRKGPAVITDADFCLFFRFCSHLVVHEIHLHLCVVNHQVRS